MAAPTATRGRAESDSRSDRSGDRLRCASRMRRTGVRAAIALAIAVLTACTGSSDSRLAEIRQLHAAGDFQASIAPLRSLLQRDPSLPEANFLLGIALVQTGKPVLAVTPLRKAAEDPDHGVTAGTLLAALLSSNQQHQAAAAAAGRVIELDSENLLALQVRAASFLRTGRDEEALSDARLAVEISPGALQARVLEAVALDRLGRRDEAAEAEARLFEAAREADQEGAEVRSCVTLALLHHELGNAGRGRATIDGCLGRFPSDPFVLQQASTLYDLAGEADAATDLWRSALAAEPDRESLYPLLAARLERQGRLDEARAVLESAAKRFGDAASLTQLARFHQLRGDFAAASATLDRALEASGEPDVELTVIKVELLIETGELDDAEQLIEEIEVPVYRELLRGRVLAARGRDAEALEAFEAGIAQAPSHAAARFLAGATAERLGLIDKAIFHYREATQADAGATDAPLALARLLLARGRAPEAAQAASVALAARPRVAAGALVIGARAEAATGDVETARMYIERLEQLPGQQLRALVERADLAARFEGPGEAVRILEQSGLDFTAPESAEPLLLLTRNLVALGRSEEAVALFDAAIARDPESPLLFNGRARVHFGLGQRDAARADFREALRLQPEYVPALTGLGTLASAEGNVEEAIALLDRANSEGIRDPDGALLAAQLVEAQGRSEEAEQRVRAVVSAFPDHAHSLNQLAWTLASAKRELDTALELADRAVGIEPSPEILDTLGWVRLQRGEASLAIAAFERAIAEKPDASSTRYRLGLALAAAGRQDEARKAFEQALEDPRLGEASEARAALDALDRS